MSVSKSDLAGFADCLKNGDRSPGTIEKYLHDASDFALWLGQRELTRETAVQWREFLLQQNYAPVTINSMLSAVNSLFKFLGRGDCRIRFLRVQRRAFREQSRELTRAEYQKLLDTAAEQGQERLGLLMETICATGIRVSEVRYITVEAAQRGRAEISLKGKIRTILLPAKLCRKLLKYARKQKTASGEIFLTRSGKPVSRRQIWREMKALCEKAGVESSKVFPHNLRHLFATLFYKACRDIVKLADILGHSSINTTRIYLMTTGAEHARQLEKLGLVT
ncbi:MAG: tyrosine-type recombinase/integrase [Oscillospiraceae bacterium]|jgi:site-specific recombinase XerD|nr:tyrosine-type recombinase/integrase [Oscillospiraceae bacterium]